MLTVEPAVPRFIIAVPTFRCPLRCRHCDLPALKRREIDPGIWRLRIAELARVARRPFMAGISGGEPLVYRGIHAIVEACAQNGIFSNLSTSSWPLDAGGTRRILDAGINSLVFSLDGLGSEHDAFRRRPGLFEHALEVIERVRAMSPRLAITVVTTVCKTTVNQLADIVRWVEDVPSINAVCLHTISANLGSDAEVDPDWHRDADLWPGDLPALEQALDEVIALKDAGGSIVNSRSELQSMKEFFRAPHVMLRPCDQNRSGMIILPDGSVKICPIRDPVGTVATHSLLEIWQSAAAEALRRSMGRCERNCHFLTNFACQRHLIG